MSEATETDANTDLNKVSAMMVDVSGLDVDKAVHKIIDHARPVTFLIGKPDCARENVRVTL